VVLKYFWIIGLHRRSLSIAKREFFFGLAFFGDQSVLDRDFFPFLFSFMHAFSRFFFLVSYILFLHYSFFFDFFFLTFFNFLFHVFNFYLSCCSPPSMPLFPSV
jgi:hypothetical protein